MTGQLDAWRALGRRLDPQDPRAAREATGLLVSQLFFAPLLAEMRRLPFGREFGHGGRMEEAFAEQLDLRIADTVARSDQSLTAPLTEKLMRRHPSTNVGSQPIDCPPQIQARATGAGGDK